MDTLRYLRSLELVVSFHDGHDFLEGLVLLPVEMLDDSPMAIPLLFRCSVWDHMASLCLRRQLCGSQVGGRHGLGTGAVPVGKSLFAEWADRDDPKCGKRTAKRVAIIYAPSASLEVRLTRLPPKSRLAWLASNPPRPYQTLAKVPCSSALCDGS